MDRPRLCPEPRCSPIFQWGDVSGQDAGESWMCFGRMPEEIVFTYAGNDHTNDLRSCHFTPLKGLIAYQENRDDWWAIERAYRRAREKLDEAVGGEGG